MPKQKRKDRLRRSHTANSETASIGSGISRHDSDNPRPARPHCAAGLPLKSLSHMLLSFTVGIPQHLSFVILVAQKRWHVLLLADFGVDYTDTFHIRCEHAGEQVDDLYAVKIEGGGHESRQLGCAQTALFVRVAITSCLPAFFGRILSLARTGCETEISK